MTATPRFCAVVPTYDNPLTIGAVVAAIAEHDLEVIVVDDGSGEAGREACAALARDELATVHRLPRNRGKGAAVKAGFAIAAERGFTHAFQVDADGQHDLSRIPPFVAAAHEHPDALIIGYPEYDPSAPQLRRSARRITNFWVNLELGKGVILDAMIGFRIYPLAAVQRLPRLGNRMDFDIEIAVRLVLQGTKAINLPVPVRYLDASEGGVSHFQPLRDNLRFSWLHSRLCTSACVRWLLRPLRRGAGK